MYGAGNIGRGFIGALLSQIGYDVTFIDVNVNVVNALNTCGGYHQEIVGEHPKVNWISGVRAIDGSQAEAVIDAIAHTDLMAVALGVSVLPRVIPLIAKGLMQRWAKDPKRTLDLLICENLMHADQIIRSLLKDALDAPYDTIMEDALGLVETSIGRMVPVMTDAMKKQDPLRICVEAYDYLPIDAAAVKGSLPAYKKLVPYSPFDFYLERKLYLHNMGHALTAYLGKVAGLYYIYEAIELADIRLFVESAMSESAMAIAQKYDIPFASLKIHSEDLVYRFGNRALKDTIDRVTRDALRKLQPEDRLVGAARNVEAQGIKPVYLSLGIAACLCQQMALSQETRTVEALLSQVCKIDPKEPLGLCILAFTKQLRSGTIDWQGLRTLGDGLKEINRGMLP
ncbi:mannitol dehydrogenase [Eubacterium barkeri]|uniref:Mannitol-1-phosphate 5-dehydrogenase n=1 Tax=Eubacterium barkeri TaxID=1528 RepID=A0A1H3G2N5_EUBBA|nr:mannitol dehydrogenase [Eubacterium barkeri]SDX97370.1 mannitol-1-phosphate 5-dehydrogenase [Eubacterium barkeri]